MNVTYEQAMSGENFGPERTIDGYYWVKHDCKWVISERVGGWYFVDGNGLEKEELDEIGDYIETPDKYKE